MIENVKLVWSIFFIVLIFFISTVSAQNTAEKAETTETPQTPSTTAAAAAAAVAGSGSSSSGAAEEKKASETEAKEAVENKGNPSVEEEKKDEAPQKQLDVSYRLRRGEKELIFEMGSSPFNPSNFTGPKEYDVYGRDLHLGNFRWGRIIGTKGIVTFQYLFGATPLTVFTKNEIKNPAYVSQSATPNVSPTVRKMTWGMAVQPVNFRFIFLPDSRWKPFAQVGAGVVLSNKAIPVPRATAINFTGDFGGGIQFFTSRTRAVTFGYRYFHISNANWKGRANNPGYNANVFYVSYSFFYR